MLIEVAEGTYSSKLLDTTLLGICREKGKGEGGAPSGDKGQGERNNKKPFPFYMSPFSHKSAKITFARGLLHCHYFFATIVGDKETKPP
ncbi:hypothetical protein NSTC731_00612 [Nostoc sp. DSM 114167]|jgi:hypothetical protein